MFRWSYLVPRLLALLAVCLFVRFGVGPLLRWSLIRSGETALGAKVEIGDLQVAALRGNVQFTGVQVANPRSPDKNLVEFHDAVFDLDPQQLMKRKFVVNRGSISGLKFSTDRAASGKLTDTPRRPPSEDSGAVGQWLDGLSGKFRDDLENELESVRLAKELAERWPAEFDKVQARAEAWKDRIESLCQSANDLRGNPAQNLDFYRQRMGEIDEARREIPEIRAELERLKDQVANDRVAIAAAKEHDREKIRQMLRLDELDSQKLSEYLLDESLLQHVNTITEYVRRGRELLAAAGEAPELNTIAGRGVDVEFASLTSAPDLLARHLAIDGELEINATPLAFRGVVQDVTHQPRIHGRPTVAVFMTEGMFAARVRATIDRTTRTPRERVVIDCPQLLLPGQSFGNEDRLSLAVSPASARLWAGVEMNGEKVTGQIVLKQDQIELKPTVKAELAGVNLNDALQMAMKDVRKLHVALQLGGTLKRPNWKVESNLGPQLATGLNLAMQRELEVQSQRIARRAESAIARQTAKLDVLVSEKQNLVRDAIQIGDERIAALKQQFARGFGLPTQLIGDGSPLHGLMQR